MLASVAKEHRMLFEWLFKRAQDQPQDVAVIDDQGQYTYPQLAAMSAGLGVYLGAQTDQPRVGLFLPPGAGFVDAAIEQARLEHKHTFLGVIPLFHAFGMTAMMLAPIQLGAPVIYMARFSAAGAMQKIREQNVSLVFGVPSMFGAIAHLKNA